MSGALRLSLLGDGPSDRCLLVIIRRLVGKLASNITIESHWADLRHLDPRPLGLGNRMKAALENYPCELLFVHRDAEAQPWEYRATEIREAAASLATEHRWVPVIPVRMTEAWLLLDEAAIRMAADCPAGTTPLGLPKAQAVETRADPKAVIREALSKASEKKGRRMRRFTETIGSRIHRVAEIMTDFSGLESLPAYQRLSRDTSAALDGLGLLAKSQS